MAATARLVARDELLVGGIQEQDAVVDAGALSFESSLHQAREEAAVARVAHHGDASMVIGLAGHAG